MTSGHGIPPKPLCYSRVRMPLVLCTLFGDNFVKVSNSKTSETWSGSYSPPVYFRKLQRERERENQREREREERERERRERERERERENQFLPPERNRGPNIHRRCCRKTDVKWCFQWGQIRKTDLGFALDLFKLLSNWKKQTVVVFFTKKCGGGKTFWKYLANCHLWEMNVESEGKSAKTRRARRSTRREREPWGSVIWDEQLGLLQSRDCTTARVLLKTCTV